MALELEALTAGEFAGRARLATPAGKTLDARGSAEFIAGRNNLTLSFTANEIRRELGEGQPYKLAQVDIQEISDDLGFILAFRRMNVVDIAIGLAEICKPAIELKTELTVTPRLVNGYIDSLDFVFPVDVSLAGSYQISFKIIGANGDIDLLAATRSLTTGTNPVTFNVPANKFQSVDGPYHAISLLLLGPAGSSRLDSIGNSEAWQRWQFKPLIRGDLNNDGAVGPSDGALLTGYRGNRALVPGDRRDINRDGVIDVRDVRELQKLSCAIGTCPP